MADYYGLGTAFRISLGGALTTLHSFDGTDGANLLGELAQDTSGTFYGTTSAGGSSTACSGGCGTVFALSTLLHPFVRPVPAFGKVEQPSGFSETASPERPKLHLAARPLRSPFHSATLLTATVPVNAKTGAIQVTTPSGTLTSNVYFWVLP